MTKRFRPINRRRRHQQHVEEFGPEPENDDVVNACLTSSFQESADFQCEFDEDLDMGSQVCPRNRSIMYHYNADFYAMHMYIYRVYRYSSSSSSLELELACL